MQVKSLGTLIEGESLLNDGTAIVAFILLFGVVTAAEPFLGTGAFIGSAAVDFGQIGAAGGLLEFFSDWWPFMGRRYSMIHD